MLSSTTIALYIIVSTLAISGNIIIAVLIVKDKKHYTTSGKLLLHQAFVDCCIDWVFVFLMYYDVIYEPELEDYSNVGTKIRIIFNMLYSLSFQTLGATAFTLYLAICFPVKYKIYNTTWRVVTFIVLLWILNTVIGFLYFTTPVDYIHNEYALFSFYRIDGSGVWYEVLKFVVMFILPVLAYYSLVCIMKYVWNVRRGTYLDLQRATVQRQLAANALVQRATVQTQCATNALVRQALGVLLILTAYVTIFVCVIVVENLHSIPRETRMMISDMCYFYPVLKLALFLLAFKPYRKVFKSMFCPCGKSSRVGTLESQTQQSRK